LKAKLGAEGLFEPARKRPLPPRPATIGIATSVSGAVLHDILQVLRRRWPLTRVVVAACQVQGDPAPASIVTALDRLARYRDSEAGAGVDVAIELSGVTAGLQDAIRACRVAGTVCSAGFYQRDAQGLWLGREWHHNRLTMVVPHGCGWGHPPRDYPRWDRPRAHEAIVSLMRQGKLQAPGLIDPVVGFDDVSEVYRLIRDEPDRVVKYAVRFA
jgi:threonine dehydrogenase-like Zn-dependent dehydrogenase